MKCLNKLLELLSLKKVPNGMTGTGSHRLFFMLMIGSAVQSSRIREASAAKLLQKLSKKTLKCVPEALHNKYIFEWWAWQIRGFLCVSRGAVEETGSCLIPMLQDRDWGGTRCVRCDRLVKRRKTRHMRTWASLVRSRGFLWLDRLISNWGRYLKGLNVFLDVGHIVITLLA